MANEQNLIPNDQRTPKERRENARKAGIKSGEARRKKKTFKELFDLLLALPIKDDETKTFIRGLGIEDENLTNDMSLILSMYQEALKGNTKAFELIRDTRGEKPADKVEVQEAPKITLNRPNKK